MKLRKFLYLYLALWLAFPCIVITIWMTGYNLLTFDKFDIMDPECNPNNADSYPIIKIYNLGINLTF